MEVGKMASNILTVYLSDGFNDGFVTDLIDYIKKQTCNKSSFTRHCRTRWYYV